MNGSGDWMTVALEGDAFTLDAGVVVPVPDLASARGAALALRRVDEPAGTVWALVVGRSANVLVNGVRATLGLVALSDRDEVRADGGQPLFFSTETRAHVSPFPASGPRGFCPRCKQQIEQGTPAVRCPGCNLWYHSSDDLGCWTYAPHCSVCPQETALDAGFRWTPEEL